ncbi:MAG: hypothetical protein AAF629_01110, partial [Chloroflexota bacterium]
MFSPNGGGQWYPATVGSGGDGIINLTASLTGTEHTFVWQVEADLIKQDQVLFGLQVHSTPAYGPIMWPVQTTTSPPFRVEAPFFIRVVDGDGKPVAGADVYADGKQITQTLTGQAHTNQAGLLNPGHLAIDTALVAVDTQAIYTGSRAMHDKGAYLTTRTNIGIDKVGETEIYHIEQSLGGQRLQVMPTQTLILFNVLVSIEWDAEEVYLQDVAAAMDAAADFFYDVSDGQMTFGQVTIYDDAAHWTDADIQISAKNVVQPHAYVGGIFEDDKSHLIRVGRYWDGQTANQGPWSNSDGYRTLVHEIGHYALGLFDEYFGYEVIGDELAGRKEAYCLSPANRDPLADETNVSIMDYHYTSSEFADATNWALPTSWCRETAQHLL